MSKEIERGPGLEETNHFSQVSKQAIMEIGQYIDIYIDSQARNDEQTQVLFFEIIDLLDLFSQLLPFFTRHFRGLQKGEGPKLFEETKNELLVCLTKILEAKESKDQILLCDLLEYELKANLSKWKEIINKT